LIRKSALRLVTAAVVRQNLAGTSALAGSIAAKRFACAAGSLACFRLVLLSLDGLVTGGSKDAASKPFLD
jgi:hypothetical protein